MDWDSSIVGVVVGGLLVLLANRSQHRHRVTEGTLERRRQTYAEFLKHTLIVRRKLRSPEHVTQDDLSTLIRDFDNLVAEVGAFGSHRVNRAIATMAERIIAEAPDATNTEERWRAVVRVYEEDHDAIEAAIRRDLRVLAMRERPLFTRLRRDPE